MALRTIGLIGVGLVGTALAERWHTAGWAVVGYDLDPIFAARLESFGGTAAKSAREAIEAADIIVFSFPTSAVSSRVLAENVDLLAGKILLDTTTGEPHEMSRLGEVATKHGIRFLAATIAGSSAQIRTGEVLVMLGGDAATVADCEDVFNAFASRSIHVGSWSAAAQMKLVVNLVLGLHRAVLAEALSFAKHLGIDARQALEVLEASPAASRVMETKGEKMLTGDFSPQARLSQHYKDVRLILAAGEESGARLPLSHLHAQLLAEREAAGDGDLDNSAIIRAFQPPTSP